MRSIVFLLTFSLALVPLAAQQDMGVITGLVTDGSGGVVAQAAVTVTNQQTGETRTVATGDTGAFTVGPLRIGIYNLAVEKSGFRKRVWNGLEVHAQDRVRADVQLEIGQVNDVISVTAEAPILQSETSSLAKVVEEHEVRELPLNGRNFQQLAWLTAGVSPDKRGRDIDSGFNSHGQAFTQNSFIVDGIDNNNNVMGMQDRKMQVVVPSLDAVAEFKVETSNYSAEFGRNSGALMLVSIKSGTNQLHGSAYEYLRNNVFDARDTFNYTGVSQKLRKNLFGATVGGPVKRDRTFFFFSWERLDQRQGQSDLVIVPTAAERQGLFGSAVKDPLTGQPFPGSQIPSSRFDPVAAKLLTLWPSPNFSGAGARNNFARNPPWNTTRDQFDTRVDHNVSEKDKVFGHLSVNRFNNLQDSVFPYPARGGQDNNRAIDDNKAYSAAFSYTRIITPTLINEFRYGFIRQLADKKELDPLSLTQLTSQYGLTGIPGDGLFGLPQFTFNGTYAYQGLGETGSLPNLKISQVHQYLDNVSWNHGNHNLKFGADVRWNRSDIFGGNSAHGNFTFDGTFTGVSLADFLLGDSASFALSTYLAAQMRFQNYMGYAMDDWKVTPRLTLNLGLRYEFTTPWYEKHNHMNQIDVSPGPNFGSILIAGACGSSYYCRSLTEPDLNNWAPRIGVAWQAPHNTVVRGGFGIFYGGQGALGANGRPVTNFPYSRSATLQSSGATPAVKLDAGVPANLLSNVATPPANSNWYDFDRNFPEPMIYQWNAAVQHELIRNLALTLAYVGSSSTKIMDGINVNGSLPGPPATEKSRRPLPQWNTISYYTPYGHSSYHGLDAQIERRFADGLSVSASYTWSHSLDNVSEQFGDTGGNGLQDIHNWNASRGDSTFDTRQRFVSSFVYELPFGAGKRWLAGKGVVSALLGGWQFSGLVAAQTGHPFTVFLANARTILGATAVGDWRPDRIGAGLNASPSPDHWLNPAAFAVPRNPDGSYRFGTEGRDVLFSNGMFNFDAGLMKYFNVTERVRLQFRWETFNATNTPQYGDPNRTFGAPDFGVIRTTDSTPRQMQFALRVAF